MQNKFGLLFQPYRFAASLVILLSALAIIIGCGGSSGSNPTGIFLDSPVSGLNYSTMMVSGLTDANGTFTYEQDRTITFSIGNLMFGSAVGAPQLTPLSIVSGATSAADQRVVNICVLLQTLDADGNLNNGIQITDAIRTIVSKYATSINFDQTTEAFQADTNVAALLAELNNAHVFTSSEASGSRSLRSAADALAHIQASIGERKTVNTVFGAVRGYTANDAWIWKGIPYAKPPVGALRWKAPVDPDAWSGVREATYQCSACSQQVTDIFWRPSNAFTGSEDCLYLDIYRPKTNTTGLPVFVWIHGGANIIGRAQLYYGTALAKRGNMIVVVIQYRLGMLGWLTHPALRASGTIDDQSGNYATLDHIKALTWIKNNIAAFGGDPGKVTVGGQSAGGQNVMNLIISPKTDVLFQQAFAESPALAQMMPLRTMDQGDTQTNAIIDWLLINDGTVANSTAAADYRAGMSNKEIEDYLRSKPVTKIMQAAIGGPGGGMSMPVPTSFMDGTVLPTTSWLDTINAGNFKKVPLIIGTAQYEFKDLMTLFAPLLKYYFNVPSGSYSWNSLYDVLNGTLTFDQVLPTDLDKVAYEQAGLLKSREWQAECNTIARAIKNNNAGNTVYSYLFTWSGGGDSALADFKTIFGASHAQDVPFFFGANTDLFGGYSFTAANQAGRVALQGTMMDYLTAFVNIGNPNPAGSALLNWTQWSNTAGDPKFIKFDADLNNYVLNMDTAEATTAIVQGEISTALSTYPSLALLFTALTIVPY